MWKKITRIIPEYAIIPLLASVVFNFVAYLVPKFVVDPSDYHSLAIPGVDSAIPFVTFLRFRTFLPLFSG